MGMRVDQPGKEQAVPEILDLDRPNGSAEVVSPAYGNDPAVAHQNRPIAKGGRDDRQYPTRGEERIPSHGSQVYETTLSPSWPRTWPRGRARVHCHSPAYPGNMNRFEEAA